MRFIGNNHAIHFGAVTFVNRVTLVEYVIKRMAAIGKNQEEQNQATGIIAAVVDQIEEELRDELRQKHYHADLHMPAKSGE